MKNRIERGTGLYAENLRTIAAREIEFRLTPYIFNLGIPAARFGVQLSA